MYPSDQKQNAYPYPCDIQSNAEIQLWILLGNTRQKVVSNRNLHTSAQINENTQSVHNTIRALKWETEQNLHLNMLQDLENYKQTFVTKSR